MKRIYHCICALSFVFAIQYAKGRAQYYAEDFSTDGAAQGWRFDPPSKQYDNHARKQIVNGVLEFWNDGGSCVEFIPNPKPEKGNYKNDNFHLLPPLAYSDYAFNFKMQVVKLPKENYAGIGVNAVGYGNMLMGIQGDGTPVIAAGNFPDAVKAPIIARGVNKITNPTEWHSYSIHVRDNGVTLLIDGVKQVQYPSIRISNGAFVLRIEDLARKSGKVRFDDLEIKPLATPTYKLPDAELTNVVPTIFYEENFENNDRNWYNASEDEWAIRYIKNGKFYFECKAYKMPNGGTSWCYAPKLILPKDNFVIECKTLWVKNMNNNGYFHAYGFMVGFYTIELYGNSESRLLYWDGKKNNVIVDYHHGTKDLYTRGPGNVDVKMIFKGGNIYLYGNEKLMLTGSLKLKEDNLRLFVAHSEVVEFDELKVRTLTPEEYKKIEADRTLTAKDCSGPNPTFHELSYKLGSLTDAEIEKLKPEEQLVDHVYKQGVCMHVNPLWSKYAQGAKDGYFIISANKLDAIRATLPPMGLHYDKAEKISWLSLAIAKNPRTVEATHKIFDTFLMEDVMGFYTKLGKTLSNAMWESLHPSLFTSISFKTTSGLDGSVFIYRSPGPETFIDKDLNHYVFHPSYLIVLVIPQGNEVIQVTVQLQRYVNMPKTTEVKEINKIIVLNDQDEGLWLGYLEHIFKSVYVY